MVSKVERSVFIAYDGQEFLTEQDAVTYERKLGLTCFFEEHGFNAMSTRDVVDIIIEHSAEFGELWGSNHA